MAKGPYVEHRYESWQDFLNDNYYFADQMDFVFRGHGCSSWKLETTLDRLIHRLKPNVDLDSTYDFVLKEFVKSLRGRSSVAKDVQTNSEELWALGPHYGLTTPLLDWTHSIYVALFFAFEDHTPSSTGYRTIWALSSSRWVVDAMASHNAKKNEKHWFNFLEPLSDNNPRLITQTGLFTKQPIQFYIISWAKENLPNDAPYLIKIDVPDSERLKILRHLRLMNIHPATLFPETDGAAKYCNQKLELLSDKSRGPRQ